jgi:TolB protein
VSETAAIQPVIEPAASPTATPLPAAVASTAPSPAAPSGNDVSSLAGQIVFLSGRDHTPDVHPEMGPFEIYVMNPDGSNQRAITKGLKLSNLSAPVVSPDGTQIIVAGRGGKARILSADGAIQRTISTPTQQGFMLDWSKTGKVLYAGYPGANGPDLYSIDVNSGSATRLTNDDYSQMFATWSPDGSQIAYMHDYFLYVMNADGSGKRQLVEGEARDMDWSPDGSRIVFESQDIPKMHVEYDLRTVNADGSGKTLIADTPGTPLMAPSWSPDGQQVVFEAWFDPPKGYPQIIVLDVGSGEMKQLTRDGYNTQAFWVDDPAARR